MEAKRESYYTCQGTEGVCRGIPWLQEQGRNGLIVTIGPDNLDALSSCLAPERIGQLKGGADVELSASLKLLARTERSLGQSWDGPVLVIHPSRGLLDKVDTLKMVTKVLVVPWVMSDVQSWINRCNAVPVDGAPVSEEAQPKAVADGDHQKILEVALGALTMGVTISTGLASPSDCAKAIDLFNLLKSGQIPYDPEQVKNILITKHEWPSHHADEVKVVAEKIKQGSQLKKHKDYQAPQWKDGIVEQWRKEAQKGLASSSG